MKWRFIPYAEFDGASNMSIDVSLLERAAESPPVLRLYGFSPPCVSFGLNQEIPAETVRRVKDRGFELVRRPSGGRAVLHYRDLTYCFIASEKGAGDFGLLEHSVSAAYRQICAGLQKAFLLLGVNARLGAAQSAYRHLSDCFLATTSADLHIEGRKLAGSAQLRRRSSVLQHGSIPLCLEQQLMPELLGGAESSSKLERHANLFEVLGRALSFAELDEIMKKGFEQAFDCEFEERALELNELEQAHRLRTQFEYSGLS